VCVCVCVCVCVVLMCASRPGFDVCLWSQTGEDFTYLYSLIGFLCLLYSFKVFRYLSISKKMSSLWLTLARASSDLISFGIG
jgi:Polycystin cation channel